MFGLSQIQERLISIGIMAIMAISAFFYIEHLGAQRCEKGVDKSNTIEVKREDIQHGKDETTVKKEGQTFETAKTEPIAPAPVITLGVCPTLHHQTGPSASAPGPGSNAEASARTTDTQLPSVQWDTEPVVRVAHEGDKQIEGLQDYITKVCRPGN